MDTETFDELSSYVLQHPFIGNWTTPQQEAGLVSRVHPWAHCNDKGFYKLCSSSDIRFLCEPFLKRVRQKGTNAFVLKLFAGYASDYDAQVGGRANADAGCSPRPHGAHNSSAGTQIAHCIHMR